MPGRGVLWVPDPAPLPAPPTADERTSERTLISVPTDPPAEARLGGYAAMTDRQIVKLLRSSPSGLVEAEADDRLATAGDNGLPTVRSRRLTRLLATLRDLSLIHI